MTSTKIDINPVVSPERAPLPFGEVITYDLPAITVPDSSLWWHALGCYLHTGSDNVRTVIEEHYLSRPPQRTAMDIETHGVEEGKFSVTCITVAFRDNAGAVHSVMLDPLRVPQDMSTVRRIVNHASSLVFHNATFDVPPLYAHGIFAYLDINKVEDTILLSRLVHTNRQGGRTLEALAAEYGVGNDTHVKIETAMRAAGFSTKTEGFTHCDIDKPFYRLGAMSDTAVTLRLWGPLHDHVMDTICGDRLTTNNPRAFLSTSGAHALIQRMITCLRVTLRAAGRGLKLDRDYMNEWLSQSEQSIEKDADTIAKAGLRYNVGADVVQYLDARNELLGDWPRTEKGALKSDKAAMKQLDKLGHQVARAHSRIAEREKNHNYFKAMAAASHSTGRVHTSLSVLGASASGRMSANSPAIQQFSDEARKAIISDTGRFWSVDWSSIEPVVLANAAGDINFIEPFNRGHDLYVPTAQKAGLIPAELSEAEAMEHPGRKKSKTMLLAQMYGQGLGSLAAAHGWEEVEAERIADGMRAAMGPTFQFMERVRSSCAANGGFHNTLSGRVLEDTIQVNKPAWGAEPQAAEKTTKIVDRVAVNHFCQGTAADVLYDTTARLEEMGAGDHIHLWLHDELVTDDEGLEAVKEAMATPPDWLVEEALTEKVVLRIDAQDMGLRWQKV
ncbi:DNA polymerase [Corynebacterium sp. AOP12-C2-36]|uniref:DNA polymerase n=1 Tax=Corynebacterium sp. AOP12-C2-36 TaxID=3457723 RepID=UPI0040332923